MLNLVGGIAAFAIRRALEPVARRAASRTATDWDNVLVESGVLRHLAPLVPTAVVYLLAGIFGTAQIWIEPLALIYMVGIAIRVANALLDAGLEIYESQPASGNTPVRGSVQLVRVILGVGGGIFILATAYDLARDDLEPILESIRAEKGETISTLIENGREALERVREDDSDLASERSRILREVRKSGPALLEAAARRVGMMIEREARLRGLIETLPDGHEQMGELEEGVRELDRLASDAKAYLASVREEVEADLETDEEVVADSLLKIDAAFQESVEREAELSRQIGVRDGQPTNGSR
jgi:hypothetical protein